MSGPRAPRVQRIADAHLLVGLDQPVEQLVGAGLLDEHPPGCSAPLARGPHCPEDDGPHRQIHIRAIVDDDGVVAAQLEQGSAQPLPDQRGHVAADGTEPVNEINGKRGSRTIVSASDA